MNNMSFMIWFSVYACAMITLGWYVSRKQKTGEDFLLGGRSLPMILTLGSTVGTMVGTGSSVGAVGFGYSNGWAGMLYGLGGAVGILLVAWLFAPVRKLRFMTMSEETSYYTGGSKIIKNLVAILIFIASIGWLGAHILGGGLYLAWASGIDINVAKIIIALAFVVYVGIGGYSAVVWIDTIQSIVLFVGFILMAILAVHHVGGWSHIQQAVDPAAQSLFAVDKLGVLPALSLAMVIGVGVLATPSYRQRIYSAKTVSSVRQSFTITGLLYLGFSFLPAIIGMAVWTMNPQLENSGFAFLFATQVLPPVLAMAILIAGMSANMSSGSSDAIAAVSIMLRDLYTLVTGHMPAPEKAIRLSRIFLVLVIALALLFALTSNDIISYITKMISMIMSGMFICTMLGRFWTRFNWQGAVAALAGGAEAVFQQQLAPWRGDPALPVVMAGMIGSDAGWQPVPYLACPLALEALNSQLYEVAEKVWIVPGLKVAQAADYDVMRGEETQLLGAWQLMPAECYVMPGTHCKWVQVQNGVVRQFATAMTGELHHLLLNHSLLGQQLPAQLPDEAAFALGMEKGLNQPALLSGLFSARAARVLGALAATSVSDYLSGLLIGAEVATFSERYRASRVVLVGEHSLSARYQQAMAARGLAVSCCSGEAAFLSGIARMIDGQD